MHVCFRTCYLPALMPDYPRFAVRLWSCGFSILLPSSLSISVSLNAFHDKAPSPCLLRLRLQKSLCLRCLQGCRGQMPVRLGIDAASKQRHHLMPDSVSRVIVAVICLVRAPRNPPLPQKCLDFLPAAGQQRMNHIAGNRPDSCKSGYSPSPAQMKEQRLRGVLQMMSKRDPHRACRIRPPRSRLRERLLPQDSAGLLRGQPLLRRIIRRPNMHHSQRDFPLLRERTDIRLIPVRRRPQPMMHMHRLQRPGKPSIFLSFI